MKPNKEKEQPFKIRVLAVKGNPFDTDKECRQSELEGVHRVPCLEASPETAPNRTDDSLLTTANRLAAPKGERRGTVLENVESLGLNSSRYIRLALRKILLLSSGQFGMAAMSLIALVLTFQIFSISGEWTSYAFLGLLTVRFAYYISRGPVPILARHRIRKKLSWVITDEIQIAVGFMAACFLLSWPIGFWPILAFVAINLLLQIGILGYSKAIMNLLKVQVYESESTEFASRALILGTGQHAQRVADMVVDSPDLDTKVLGFLDYANKGLWRYRDIPLLGHPENLESIVSNGQVDAVFVAVDPEDISRSRTLFDTAERMGVCVFVMPNVYYPTVSKIRPTYVNGMPALEYRSAPENRASLFMKSVMDKIGAIVGLLFASPIMILAALAVKIDSKGPVFFKQQRTGVNGRVFHLYKFRTMCADAEEKKKELLEKNEMTGPAFKMALDPRVTRIGSILRKFSIDELPQFLNVLKGDMSLVGPRPPLPAEVKHYLPWQHRKLSVKPGVTCLWQVNGRHNVGFDDWMRLDLEYIDNWSLWLDTKIILRTIPEVMKGSGV